MNSMNMVFMGTPDIAAASLKKLIEAGHTVSAVFTKPDKPVGRKQILTPPPVKVLAEQHNIPVFQPETLRDGTAYDILREINPEIIVVVAYGKILPREILDLPKFGCINAHASLLPKYRGSSPIQWSIVCGEKQTGITTMYMDDGVDTGDMLEKAVVDIGENETAEELFDRLSVLAGEVLCQTLEKIENGTAVRTPQNEAEATHAPMIKKEMGEIDFTKSAADIHNLVRGFYSWPAAYTFLGGKRLKIYRTEIVKLSGTPRTVLKSDNQLVIACGDNAVRLCDIQLEGGKRTTDTQFLLGNKIECGSII